MCCYIIKGFIISPILDLDKTSLRTCLNNLNNEGIVTKEIVKHRKDDKKKPTMTAKEKKAKKQEKKQGK